MPGGTRQGRTAMSVATSTQAFRYTPGDGYVFTWTGDPDRTIAVYRVTYEDGTRREVPTGDRIMTPERRTAAALMATVDEWRATR
jgi:alanine racemase